MKIHTSIHTFLNENKKIWYHGSDYKFDTFQEYKSNGPSALGIFVTDSKDLAELFGDNLYLVNINYFKPYILKQEEWNDIREEHATDTSYFINMRKNLIDKGYDSIFIKEDEWTSSRGLTFKDPNIVILFEKSQLEIVY